MATYIAYMVLKRPIWPHITPNHTLQVISSVIVGQLSIVVLTYTDVGLIEANGTHTHSQNGPLWVHVEYGL